MLICLWLCICFWNVSAADFTLYNLEPFSPTPKIFSFILQLTCIALLVVVSNQQEVDYRDFDGNKTDGWEGTNFQRPVNL